jgi:hypothetical protein
MGVETFAAIAGLKTVNSALKKRGTTMGYTSTATKLRDRKQPMNSPVRFEPLQPIAQPSISLGNIYQRLNLTSDKIAAFCEKWQIVELSLFGSVLRNDFRADGNNPSDIDVLYTSTPEARYGFKFLDMKSELETLLNRKVDLISKRGIQSSRNPLRRQEILESAQRIYVKGSSIYS